MRPSIDIIIPFHGQYELLFRCLHGINHCTPNSQFNIILVDDCSPNEIPLEVARISNKKIIATRLEVHSGFAAAINHGLTKSKNSHIIIMHSDCEPDNISWLIELQRSLDGMKSSGVKLVSSRCNSPGSANSCDERVFGDRGSLEEDAIATKPLPLFCALMHKELFVKIGKLKEYPFAWYEDAELFYRMKYYGYHQAICAKSYCKHVGAATIKDLYVNEKIKKTMEQNENRFLADVSRLK